MSKMTSPGAPQISLAAAAALAAGSASYAQIIVVAPPADIPNAAAPATNPAVGGIGWDVNGDLINNFLFTFRNPQASPGNGVQWQANMNPSPSGGIQAVAGYQGPFINYGSVIAANELIGPTLPGGVSWRNQSQITLGSFYRSGGVVSPYGGFATGTVPSASIVRGFVGFRFAISGQTHYGWLDVEVRGSDATAGSGGLYFYGAAYESSPNTAIPAGVIPAPGALVALAIGAAGLLRRKRSEAVA
jgi:hypothetical protein